MKEVALSTDMHQWFCHDLVRCGEFGHRDRDKLHHDPALLGQLRSLARVGPLTLAYSARD